MKITCEMVDAGVKEAIKLGLIPEAIFKEDNLLNLSRIRKILHAALSAAPMVIDNSGWCDCSMADSVVGQCTCGTPAFRESSAGCPVHGCKEFG